jgi:hypothetical protein
MRMSNKEYQMSILEVSSTFVDRRFLVDSYCYQLSVISYPLSVIR